RVETLAAAAQVVLEIPEEEARALEADDLLRDEALEICARVGLDRHYGARARLLQHVAVALLERAVLEHVAIAHASQRLDRPVDARVVEERKLTGAKPRPRRRKGRPPVALEDVERALRIRCAVDVDVEDRCAPARCRGRATNGPCQPRGDFPQHSSGPGCDEVEIPGIVPATAASAAWKHLAVQTLKA